MAKMTVSGVEDEIDYQKLMREFGVEPIDTVAGKVPNPSMMFRRGIIFAHRDLGAILESAKNKKPFAVLTGFNPSGELHLGNLFFLKQALFFQKLGGTFYLPISNDETYVFKKSDDLDKTTDFAYKEVIPSIIAVGFEPEKTKIFVSTRTPKAYELAVKLSRRATFSTIKAIFGFTNDTNVGQIFYTVMQSAHILFPQLREYGGPKPTVVPVGLDQDPYLRLVRDVAEKEGFVKPSSTYHKFMPGLQGGKMSGSKPETCIYLNDEPAVARKKIMRAFSGGGASLEEHRAKGGDTEKDVAFQYLKFMFEEDDAKLGEIEKAFRSGAMTSGEIKKLLTDRVERFLREHQQRKEKARKLIKKFLIQ